MVWPRFIFSTVLLLLLTSWISNCFVRLFFSVFSYWIERLELDDIFEFVFSFMFK